MSEILSDSFGLRLSKYQTFGLVQMIWHQGVTWPKFRKNSRHGIAVIAVEPTGNIRLPQRQDGQNN